MPAPMNLNTALAAGVVPVCPTCIFAVSPDDHPEESRGMVDGYVFCRYLANPWEAANKNEVCSEWLQRLDTQPKVYGKREKPCTTES